MGVVTYIDNFPRLIARANYGQTVALDLVADEIVQDCKDRSRVRSGEMRDGWQKAKGERFERMVFNPTPWTIFNENGTIYMDAQPMIRPAVESATPMLMALTKKAWFG